MRPTASPCSTSMQAETCDGVVYARVGGIVTLGGVERIRRELAPVANDGAPLICLDYTRSALALTLHDMATLALVARPGASGLAMAWIVPDEKTADLWWDQALKFARVGLRRFVTTDPAEAHHWAALQSREAAALR
jgi:hypothetical protein